jgi:hypothetical protein
MHIHDVTALEGFTVKILCGNFWNRKLTHRPALHLTHLLLHVGFASQTEYTQPYSLSQAVTIVLSIRQATFCYYRLLSSIRNEGTPVFLLHISDLPSSLSENIKEKSWLHKAHNYLEWECQKSACLISVYIDPSNRCLPLVCSLCIVYLSIVVDLNCWTTWPLKLGPIGHPKVLVSSCQPALRKNPEAWSRQVCDPTSLLFWHVWHSSSVSALFIQSCV